MNIHAVNLQWAGLPRGIVSASELDGNIKYPQHAKKTLIGDSADCLFVTGVSWLIPIPWIGSIR